MKSSKHDTLYRIRVRNNITGQIATVPDSPTADVDRLRRRLAELNEHNTTCEYWLEAVEPVNPNQPAGPGSWKGLLTWTLALGALWGIIGCLAFGGRGAIAGALGGAAIGLLSYCLFAVGAWADGEAARKTAENDSREERRAA